MLRLPQAVAAVCVRRFPILAVIFTPMWAARLRALREGARKRADLHPGLWWLVACLTSTFTLTPPLSAADSSEPAPLAAQSLLLDVTRAGPRLVAVGDRGHILLSDDEGATWRQVITPTRAMLTGVAFGDAIHGWAVGHDGVILATADAGLTWVRQESGQDLETVFLDVHFTDATHGLAVGAYGKCLATTDGGKSWTPRTPSEEEMHFNHLAAAPDGTLYLTGEMGTLLASRDGGDSWAKREVPYEGSLYGLLALDATHLLVYGLRGSVYASADSGTAWAERETAVPVLIMAGVKFGNGTVVLAGLGGNFYVSREAGATFGHWQPADYTGGVSALLATTDGALLVVGEKGAARLTLP